MSLYFSLIFVNSLSELKGVRSDKSPRIDWIFQVFYWKWQMRDDVHKLARVNVLRTSASERQKEDQLQTLVDVLKTSASERYTADQIRTYSECPPANVIKRTYCRPKRTFRTSGGRPLFAGVRPTQNKTNIL